MHLNRSRILLFFTLLALAFLLFIMNVFPYASIGLILIPLSYALGIFAYKNYMLWLGGLQGEEEVRSALSMLDDTYAVVSEVVIPPNHGDTDHIVIGRNGIFVIETKNYGGEITCDGDEWSRRKIGRGGSEYSLAIGSPSNQVKRNAKVLKDFILQHQKEIFGRKAPHIWVHGILVFTNKDAALNLKNQTVTIIRPVGLAEHIVKTKSESAFTSKHVDRMGDILAGHSR
ncbi:MAG: nuclease-related domain-containing protein [Candidatus Altiarchaeota archaeon]